MGSSGMAVTGNAAEGADSFDKLRMSGASAANGVFRHGGHRECGRGRGFLRQAQDERREGCGWGAQGWRSSGKRPRARIPSTSSGGAEGVLRMGSSGMAVTGNAAEGADSFDKLRM